MVESRYENHSESSGLYKRSGTLMSNVMFSLMLWLWLQKESYKHCLRKAWQSIRGQKCQAKIVDL